MMKLDKLSRDKVEEVKKKWHLCIDEDGNLGDTDEYEAAYSNLNGRELHALIEELGWGD
jgi:hypothetical protein